MSSWFSWHGEGKSLTPEIILQSRLLFLFLTFCCLQNHYFCFYCLAELRIGCHMLGWECLRVGRKPIPKSLQDKLSPFLIIFTHNSYSTNAKQGWAGIPIPVHSREYSAHSHYSLLFPFPKVGSAIFHSRSFPGIRIYFIWEQERKWTPKVWIKRAFNWLHTYLLMS